MPPPLSAVLDFSCVPGRAFHSFTFINKPFKLLFGGHNCCLDDDFKSNQQDICLCRRLAVLDHHWWIGLFYYYYFACTASVASFSPV